MKHKTNIILSTILSWSFIFLSGSYAFYPEDFSTSNNEIKKEINNKNWLEDKNITKNWNIENIKKEKKEILKNIWTVKSTIEKLTKEKYNLKWNKQKYLIQAISHLKEKQLNLIKKYITIQNKTIELLEKKMEKHKKKLQKKWFKNISLLDKQQKIKKEMIKVNTTLKLSIIYNNKKKIKQSNIKIKILQKKIKENYKEIMAKNK